MSVQVAHYTSQPQRGRVTVAVDSAPHLLLGGRFFYAGPSRSSACGAVYGESHHRGVISAGRPRWSRACGESSSGSTQPSLRWRSSAVTAAWCSATGSGSAPRCGSRPRVGPCVCCGEDHGLGRGEVEFAAVAPRPQLAELSASVAIARGFPRRVADGLGVARVDLMKAESRSRP